MAYVRTVKTASGAAAVQIVYSSRRGSRDIEHIGSAHADADVEVLKAVARQRLAAGQGGFELGLGGSPRAGRLEIVSSRMGHLWDALARGYDALGFDAATDGEEVFRALVLARVIEATSTLGSLRVLDEAGIDPRGVPDCAAAAAGVRDRGVAAGAGRCLRGARPAGPGQPGPLRRQHPLLRDRHR